MIQRQQKHMGSGDGGEEKSSDWYMSVEKLWVVKNLHMDRTRSGSGGGTKHESSKKRFKKFVGHYFHITSCYPSNLC